MKRFFAFLSFLVLCIESTPAQPFGEAAPGYRIYRMDYSNGSGEKGKTWFYYNTNQQMVQSNWVLNNQTRSSVNKYSYNAAGQLISTFRQFSDSLTSTEIFIYDENGNLTGEKFSRSDGVEGMARHYYKNGQKQKSELIKFKGWLSGEVSYIYTTDGKKKESFLTNKKGIAAKITYQYNNNNNLVSERWDFNGQWWQVYSYHYEPIQNRLHFYTSPYLNNNYRSKIIAENYTYNDQTGGPSTYIYNSSDQLEKKIFTRSDGLQTSTQYEYDPMNRVIRSWRKYNKSEDTILFKYQYDRFNNLIERLCFIDDSLIGFELYQYNEINQLNAGYVKNFDNWLSGTVSYIYNNEGQLSEGYFSSLDKNNAILTFKNDSIGNIVEVNWLFDSGVFQKYTYKYQE